jgi:hypothetical protein
LHLLVLEVLRRKLNQLLELCGDELQSVLELLELLLLQIAQLKDLLQLLRHNM